MTMTTLCLCFCRRNSYFWRALSPYQSSSLQRTYNKPYVNTSFDHFQSFLAYSDFTNRFSTLDLPIVNTWTIFVLTFFLTKMHSSAPLLWYSRSGANLFPFYDDGYYAATINRNPSTPRQQFITTTFRNVTRWIQPRALRWGRASMPRRQHIPGIVAFDLHFCT